MRRGVGFVATVLVAFCVAVGGASLLDRGLSSTDAAYVERATKQTQTFQTAAKREEVACKRLPAFRAAQCMANVYNSAEEHRNEEYNLAAQQTSAWWTKITGEAAVYGGVVGVVTLLLLFWTLWQNLEQTRLASAVFEADTRPVMMPEGIDAKQIAPDLSIFAFRWRNIGKTPAKIIFEETRKFPIGPHAVEEDIASGIKTPPLFPGDTYTLRTIVPPGEPFLSRDGFYTLDDARTTMIGVHGVLKYEGALTRTGSVWTSENLGMLEPSLTLAPTDHLTVAAAPIAQPSAQAINGLHFVPMSGGIKMT